MDLGMANISFEAKCFKGHPAHEKKTQSDRSMILTGNMEAEDTKKQCTVRFLVLVKPVVEVNHKQRDKADVQCIKLTG